MKRLLPGFLLLFSLQAFTQGRTVSGVVTDSLGKAIAAASIKAKSSGAGTATSDNGRFTLVIGEGDSLEITSTGYARKVIAVNANTNALTIVLSTDARNLETVVVTALGITRKSRSLTYSTQGIGSEDLNTVKNTNVLNSLNGKIAGVQVNRTSGGVGGSVRVVLRGDKSTRNSQPLYVIDGLPIVNQIGGPDPGLYNGAPDAGDILSTMNPEDIESMSVLKGASASALYGSQGSNGVILITTKKGKSGTARVDFSSSVTIDKVSVLPKLQYDYKQTTAPDATSPGTEDSWGAKGATNTSGDYVKDFFQTGITFINSLSLTTGNERSSNYISYSNTDNKGILPTSTFKQHTLTFRQTTKLLQDKLVLDGVFTGSIQNAHNRITPGIYYNPLTGLYLFPRGLDFNSFKNYEYFSQTRYLYAQNWWNINYDKDQANGGGWGGQDYQQNPYWVMNRNTVDNRNQNVYASASVKYLIAPWLNVQLRGNINNFINDYQRNIYATTQGTLARFNGNLNTTKTNTTTMYGDILLSGDKEINSDWGVNFTLGSSIQDQKGKMLIVNGSPTVPNVFLESALDKATIDVRNYDINGNVPARRKIQSVFGSVQLNYQNKLFLDFSDRNDWSSTMAFTPSKKKGYNYFSVGASGVLSELLKLPAVIDFAKLRISYAVVGNDVAAFSANPLYTFNMGGIANPPASYPVSTVPGLDLKPEKNKSFEIGTQWAFLHNRLTFDFTWYKSNTSNQYFSGISLLAGVTTKSDINAGNIENTGVEASLSYKVFNTKKFNWVTTVNFSHNKNKIVELFDPAIVSVNKDTRYTLGSSGGYTMLKQDGSFGDLYGRTFQTDNAGRVIVNATTHLPLFVDSLIGNPNPKAIAGWNNTFTYGRFSLNVLVDGKFGGKVLSITQGYLDQMGTSKTTGDARDNGNTVAISNAVDESGHAWSGTVDAQTYYKYIGGKTPAGAAYTYSATAVRMREISITYRIPVDGKIVKDLRIAAIGNNLFFFKKDAPFDPEQVAGVNAGGVGIDAFGLPAYRSYGLSLKCTF
ncbi:SusC/RagA family TonB-linked outer membrane protein [Pseudoflavitalea sp. X16]|uniref:SusC/RagA family TonB-linked outer membrane protein n=1 Tax=Paraflavitalea devenefica TaxID=2716334 RepID=UPI001420E8E8|nr:SusC/RagA family TonB-linked outer membrane protein [Paraflavitalea devenefica]NII29769.1 SusC/RagA family TonB-linked outer membrane protein [Paraflavitalea devenefica]